MKLPYPFDIVHALNLLLLSVQPLLLLRKQLMRQL